MPYRRPRSCCTNETPHCEQGCGLPECLSCCAQSVCDPVLQPAANLALTGLTLATCCLFGGCPTRVCCESSRRTAILCKEGGQNLCDKYWVGETDFENVGVSEDGILNLDEAERGEGRQQQSPPPSRRPVALPTYTSPWASGPLTLGSRDVFDSCIGPLLWAGAYGFQYGRWVCALGKSSVCRGGCKFGCTLVGKGCCVEAGAAMDDARRCCAGVCCRKLCERRESDELNNGAIPPSCVNPCCKCERNSESDLGLCETCCSCCCILAGGLGQDCGRGCEVFATNVIKPVFQGCDFLCCSLFWPAVQSCCGKIFYPCVQSCCECLHCCCCVPLRWGCQLAADGLRAGVEGCTKCVQCLPKEVVCVCGTVTALGAGAAGCWFCCCHHAAAAGAAAGAHAGATGGAGAAAGAGAGLV